MPARGCFGPSKLWILLENLAKDILIVPEREAVALKSQSF
jgi:hypothetical protein